jgi:hypothetical protein
MGSGAAMELDQGNPGRSFLKKILDRVSNSKSSQRSSKNQSDQIFTIPRKDWKAAQEPNSAVQDLADFALQQENAATAGNSK